MAVATSPKTPMTTATPLPPPTVFDLKMGVEGAVVSRTACGMDGITGVDLLLWTIIIVAGACAVFALSP
jgi:hypothetical protein